MMQRLLRPSRLRGRVSSLVPTRSASTANASENVQSESNATRYAGIAFFSLVAAGTAYLGTWQTQRYFWKVDLIAERSKQLKEAAVPLASNATASSNIDDIEFRRLKVDGEFKPGSTYYLYPRSAPAEETDSVASVRSGGYVYTLLERFGGTPIIVNRGWLPKERLDEHMAMDKKEMPGPVSITGVLRHGEERGQFTPDNEVDRRHFYYLNDEEMAKAMGVDMPELPVILDSLADEDEKQNVTLASPLRKKIHNYMEFYMTPEKHAGYAITWYAFSVAAAIFPFVRFRKARLPKPTK